MIWLISLAILLAFRRRNSTVNIIYYKGPTPEEFKVKHHPEITYNELRQLYDDGKIDKLHYEKALKKITDKIDIFV